MTDRVGQQLGNYYLTPLLGWGGFAEVYLGTHIHLNTQAAIKVLYTQLANEDREQFLAEARTLVRLEHPHIIKVLDFGIENNTPFLVMTYAPHGTLRQRYPKRSILPLSCVISYVKQIASALQYLHEQKLIHRDLKPENLLLGPNDEVLLSDFGTVLVVQTASRQGIENMAGTVTYMAPEQLQGKPRQASDQYGLAVIVYEWLCGECPFKGAFAELSTQHLLVPPPPLRAKNPEIPPAVERVIMKALSKSPQQRFSSVSAFAEALEQAANTGNLKTLEAPIATIEGIKTNASFSDTETTSSLELEALELHTLRGEESIQISSETPPLASAARAEATPTRHRISRRAILLGLGGLAILGVAGSSFIQVPKATHGLQPSKYNAIGTVPLPTRSNKKDTTVYIYNGHKNSVNSVGWAPNGQRIASGSSDHSMQVWDALTGNQAETYSHSNVVRAVAWSHDGRYIASGGRDKLVQVLDSGTGSIVLIYHHYFKAVDTLAWSPDRQRLASAGVDKTVRIWDAPTGKHVVIYHGHTDEVNSVAWSPDSKTIASGSSDKTVQVWEATTKNPLFTYRQHTKEVKAVAWSIDGSRIASGSADHTVHVWDATTGNTPLTYRGHSDVVFATAWSPDGKYIASASADKTVQIWNASDGKHIFTYRGHQGAVRSIAWSPSGEFLASGAGDASVHVWKWHE